jgi:hypothetical protein
LFSLLAHSQYTLDGHLLSADFARRLWSQIYESVLAEITKIKILYCRNGRC